MVNWQKITWLNFHRILNFIFIQTCDRPNFKKPERKQFWCLHRRGGGLGGWWVGRRVLKNCHVFADFTILNIRSIVHFFGWWEWEDHLLVMFCGRHIWVTSKIIIQKNNNKCLESKRVRYSQDFKFNYKTNRNLIIPPLRKTSRTTPLIWHLLFQSQQWKRQNNVWNIFKVNNNKDARTRSITSS